MSFPSQVVVPTLDAVLWSQRAQRTMTIQEDVHFNKHFSRAQWAIMHHPVNRWFMLKGYHHLFSDSSFPICLFICWLSLTIEAILPISDNLYIMEKHKGIAKNSAQFHHPNIILATCFCSVCFESLSWENEKETDQTFIHSFVHMFATFLAGKGSLQLTKSA